jgi:hypothetical protein
MLVKTATPAINLARIDTKDNVNRIGNSNVRACYKGMSTVRILWVTTSFLTYKHRVGLLLISTFALVCYIAYDKFFHIFF